jgi:predicted MFS family arabinose efflux permease
MKLPFFTLVLLITFASVNALLFTPALPSITQYFAISEADAQLTITWFLIGYALGQLFYGPIANRFGRKPAIYTGIGLQIISSFLCVFAGMIHVFWLLVVARFFLAVGSGVGLKITYTLVNECYEPKAASQKISYLILAFAVTPGLAVALGGILNNYFGWTACFYAGGAYGLVLLFLAARLPETQQVLDLQALELKHLWQGYATQFTNMKLISGALLMGGVGSYIYVFAAAAPFIAITHFGMSSVAYGFENLIPNIGFVIGSLTSATLAKRFSFNSIIRCGLIVVSVSVLIMLALTWKDFPPLFSLFIPTAFIYFGLCFILANASAKAMSSVVDKAHGSAVMNFINMSMSVLAVLLLGLFTMQTLLLPAAYFVLCVMMIGAFQWVKAGEQRL